MQVVTFDYGMKSNNPIDSVLFYKKEDQDTAIHISREKVDFYTTVAYITVLLSSTRIHLVIVLLSHRQLLQ